METQSNFEPEMSNMLDESISNFGGGKEKRKAKRAARKEKRVEKRTARKAKKGVASVDNSTPVESTDTSSTTQTETSSSSAPIDSTKADTKGSATASTPPDSDTSTVTDNKGGDSTTPTVTNEKFLGMPKKVGYLVAGLGIVALGVGAYFLLKGKKVPVA